MFSVIRHSRWPGLALLLVLTGDLSAAEPVVRNLYVRGLQVGGTTTLVIDGDDLTKSPRLFLPFPALQQLNPKSTGVQAIFDVTLDNSVTPGYYHLRVLTDQGVSLPVVIGVDAMPQRPVTASSVALPIALHGTVSGSATSEVKFTGKSGQKVLVEVEAQRLGSKLRPILHLLGPKRLQVAWSWATPTLWGDTRLETTLPEDGPYTLALHDAEYAATAPSFFRLRLGQWAFADQVFPPLLTQDSSGTVELVGSSAHSKVSIQTGKEPYQVLGWPMEGLWSGPRPFVGISSLREIVRQAPPGKDQELPAGSLGISGRLTGPFAEDWYRLPVIPGTKLRMEVFADRLGSPLDVALAIRGETGNELARADDRPGSLDPLLEYTVPDKVKFLRIGVLDSQGRGGPRAYYRLTIQPASARSPGSEFQLTTPVQRLSLPPGGSAVLPVQIERRGYGGSVQLSCRNLPPDVTLEGTLIPEGADGTLVTVTRGHEAGTPVLTNWQGLSQEGTKQPVLLRNHPLEKLQPWLATEIALAPTVTPTDAFQIAWGDLPTDAAWSPGNKLTLPIKVNRSALTSPVRLTLLTTQTPPTLANNQPDPNSTIKQEKAIELAAKIDQAELVILVPASVNGTVYDLTVQAELLSPDKKTVNAVAHAPVRRLEVKAPLILNLAGPHPLEANLDPKAGVSFKIQGMLERRAGLMTDATITLVGLPAGIKAESPVVKAGAKEFVLNVVLPPTVGVGELRGLKLSASCPVDAKQPNVRFRSRDHDLTLLVKPSIK